MQRVVSRRYFLKLAALDRRLPLAVVTSREPQCGQKDISIPPPPADASITVTQIRDFAHHSYRTSKAQDVVCLANVSQQGR
jgi:hypothetical protein